ncbi:MAG TPA: PEP-CTERM sorting domain-containing protein [Roseiarcus sp.]
MNALFVRFFAMAAVVAPTIADAATLLPAYTFPDGSAGFEFRTSGGITNPGVLVGFNPQPDPPGVPVLPTADLRDPSSPIFDQDAQATTYLVTVSLLLSGTPSLLLPADVILGTDTVARVTCDGSVAQACDGSVFQISLAFPAGGVTSWSSFNPQPDPPGIYFSYLATFSGEPTFALSITDGGNPLTFSPVPEPATWGLMAVGFVSLGALAMRRRPNAEAA